MFLDLLDLHIPILHVPLDSWLGMIRNKRQRTDEFRECTTNAVPGQTVKYVIDKAPRIVLRNFSIWDLFRNTQFVASSSQTVSLTPTQSTP
jgi:hypothetical protein